MRQRFYLCFGMLKESLVSPFILCAYLLALLAAVKGALPFIRYADGTSMNVLEPFIILCSDCGQVCWVLLGYLVLMCNAPFINARSMQTLVRTTRTRWSDGMLIYVLLQSLLYYLFLLMVTVILAAPSGFAGNVWSRLLYSLSQYGSGVEKEVGLYVPDVSLLETWTVQQAAIHSFLLLYLYSLVLALLLFVGNLALHWIAGSVITIIVHFIGYMLISDSMFGMMKYSLFAHGILYYHDYNGLNGPEVSQSYMLFIFLAVVLCSLEHIVIRRCDFRYSISERLS